MASTGIDRHWGRERVVGHRSTGALACLTNLHHYTTNLINAFRYWLWRSRHCHRALGRVGQHFRGHLDGGARHLTHTRQTNIRSEPCHWTSMASPYFSDFFNFGASFADERTALTSRHYQPKGDLRFVSYRCSGTATILDILWDK